MTNKELVSSIRNHINDGLKGAIPDVSYSARQLRDEAFLMRNRLIFETNAKIKLDINFFFNTIDSIPIEEMDMSTSPIIKSGICRSYIKIPKLFFISRVNPVEYIGIGPVSKNKSFTIYLDYSYKTHGSRFLTSRKPYVFIDTSITTKNYIIAYLFNIDRFKDLRYLSVRAIFENPFSISNDEDCCTDMEDVEFPAPGWMQDMIIEKLSWQYVNQYRKLNIPDYTITNTDLKG